MKKIIELIELVSPQKLKSLDIVGRTDIITDQLYHLLQKGEIMTDNEALAKLYRNTESKNGLYQAKKKLYNKLLDSIFIIDLSEKYHNEYNRAYIWCRKRTAQLEILVDKHSNNNVMPLGTAILKLARKFNFSKIVCRVLPILMRKAVYVLRDDSLMKEYRKLYEHYHEMQELENLANFYWLCISAKFVAKRSFYDSSLIDEIQHYVGLLDKKMKNEHTCKTLIFYASLRIREKEITNDYEDVIQLADLYHYRLSEYVDGSPTFKYHLLAKKLSAEITLHKFSDAYKTGKECLKNVRVGQHNWFTLQDNLITLCLYEKKYNTAYNICIETTGHREFKFLSPQKRETFTVHRAFLQFFINIGLLKVPADRPEKHRFRVSRFNNEVKIFTKDKQGFNITIIIIQFLLLFTEHNYEKAYDKISSVKSYSTKHLKKDETYRSYCFLKMLVILVESDFHKAATIRKTKALFQKLKDYPKDFQRASNHVETVPFEDLWEIILERIDNTFKGSFKNKTKAKTKAKAASNKKSKGTVTGKTTRKRKATTKSKTATISKATVKSKPSAKGKTVSKSKVTQKAKSQTTKRKKRSTS